MTNAASDLIEFAMEDEWCARVAKILYYKGTIPLDGLRLACLWPDEFGTNLAAGERMARNSIEWLHSYAGRTSPDIASFMTKARGLEYKVVTHQCLCGETHGKWLTAVSKGPLYQHIERVLGTSYGPQIAGENCACVSNSYRTAADLAWPAGSVADVTTVQRCSIM